MKKKNTWLWQLVTIYNRGRDARTNGQPRKSPYREGHRNQNGPGGSLQRQRDKAWLDGYDAVVYDEVKGRVPYAR
jgi:hypothetical protein